MEQEQAEIPTHEERLAVARKYAGWHLGYSSWADNIVRAYLHPEVVAKELLREQNR